MNCPNCGKHLDTGDNFCRECGAKVTEHPHRTQEPGRKAYLPWALVSLAAGFVILLIGVFVFIRYSNTGRVFPLDFFVGGQPAGDASRADATTPEEPLEESTQGTAGEQFIQPQPVSEDDLILFEDFTSSTSQAHALFSSDYMDFYTEEGLGVLVSKNTPGVLPVIFPGLEVADFIIEFELLMSEAYDNSAAGLIFRSDTDISDGLDEYYALYLYPAADKLVMGIWMDKAWKVTETILLNPFIFNGVETNLVRVEVKGPDMRVFINDNYTAGFYLDTLSDSGLLGLFIGVSSAALDGVQNFAFFDSFSVYRN